ncbi:MAG TPA: nucleoside kinase, partial [Bacillota bacterium]|nr:nucleoside kinase [Bacillota bacterium]
MIVTIIKELRAEPERIDVPEGILLKDLADRYQEQVPYRILAAKVDNKLEDLNGEAPVNGVIEFLDMRTQSANLIYQHSLSMIFLKAISDVVGKANVEIANSLNKGLYTEVRLFREEKDSQGNSRYVEGPINLGEIQLVEKRMREIVEKDIPFFRQTCSREKAAAQLVEDGDVEKMKLLTSTNVDTMAFYSLDGYWNFFYGKMVPSTGYIEYFELRSYNEGKAVLLRFPHHSDPSKILPYEDDFLLSQAFGETKKWGRVMKCAFVSDLNDKIMKNSYKDLILISEALHAKKIAEIAERIK